MTASDALTIDTTLAGTPVVLPAPYKNPDWPQPGGYPSNAMYHLDASGPLHVLWQQDAGKPSDRDSRLTGPARRGRRAHLRARFPPRTSSPSTPAAARPSGTSP